MHNEKSGYEDKVIYKNMDSQASVHSEVPMLLVIVDLAIILETTMQESIRTTPRSLG